MYQKTEGPVKYLTPGNPKDGMSDVSVVSQVWQKCSMHSLTVLSEI